MDTKISPLPWFAKRDGFSTVYIESRLRDGWLQEVAACGPTEAGSEQQDANAAFIVKAVNSHKQLKACLDLCLERIIAECADPDHLEEVILARAALAAAEGK